MHPTRSGWTQRQVISESDAPRGLDAVTGCTGWAIAMALANSVAIVVRHRGGDGLAQHLMVDAGQYLALGLFVGALIGYRPAWLKNQRELERTILVVASVIVGGLSLPSSFENFAARNADQHPTAVILWACVTLGSLTVPVASLVGQWFSRRGWVALAMVGAFLVAVMNNFVLNRDYYGIHLFISLSAFALGATALSGSGVQNRLRWHPQILRTVLVGAVLLGTSAILLPSNRMLLRASEIEGAPLARASISLRNLLVSPHDSSAALLAFDQERRRWFVPREDIPPRPAGPPMLGDNPIIVLITVDAVRADLLGRGDLKERLVYLRKFAGESVAFNNAYSPGSKTVVSLASLFSGKYFSQLYWRRWPNNDDSIRFPQILSESGIDTVHIAARTQLLNHKGVVRGFSEEEDLDQNERPHGNFVKSHEIMPRVQARLEQQGARPLFLFTHILDPHAPYDYGRSRQDDSQFLRYVAAIEEFEMRLKEFDAWLIETGLANRTTVIISADHGEAFGEHGSNHHSKTVYQEEVRVPLWVRIPGVAPRVVNDPVSLIDLGPTLLDLFGLPTPGEYMGESLVPFFRGHAPKLTRPIGAESRLRQMLLFGNYKVIRGANDGTFEVYDLSADPGEKNNLSEGGRSKYERLTQLFFETHQNPKYDKLPPVL